MGEARKKIQGEQTGREGCQEGTSAEVAGGDVEEWTEALERDIGELDGSIFGADGIGGEIRVVSVE